MMTSGCNDSPWRLGRCFFGLLDNVILDPLFDALQIPEAPILSLSAWNLVGISPIQSPLLTQSCWNQEGNLQSSGTCFEDLKHDPQALQNPSFGVKHFDLL